MAQNQFEAGRLILQSLYPQILGEMEKAGINKFSRQTVKKILRDHDLDPGSHVL